MRNLFLPVVPRAARPQSHCAGAYGGSFTGAVCTAPATLLAFDKKEGWEGGSTDGP